MKGYGCLPRTANFRFNPPGMLLGIGRKSNHGVISSMGFELSPQKNSFFLWLALRNRVLVDASLQVRNIQLVSRCSLCEKEGESVLHCIDFGRAPRPGWFGNLLDEWFGIQNCQGDSMVHIFLAWASHWRFVGLPKFIGNSAFAITVWGM